MIDMKEYIARAIEHSPIEAKIIKRVYKALKAAGDPIVMVRDGEVETPVESLQDVYDLVFNLDEADLCTKSNGWVFVVMGEGWDTLVDHTMNLDTALRDVNEWIGRNM